jgi:hypothetical protein
MFQAYAVALARVNDAISGDAQVVENRVYVLGHTGRLATPALGSFLLLAAERFDVVHEITPRLEPFASEEVGNDSLNDPAPFAEGDFKAHVGAVDDFVELLSEVIQAANIPAQLTDLLLDGVGVIHGCSHPLGVSKSLEL